MEQVILNICRHFHLAILASHDGRGSNLGKPDGTKSSTPINIIINTIFRLELNIPA